MTVLLPKILVHIKDGVPRFKGKTGLLERRLTCRGINHKVRFPDGQVGYFYGWQVEPLLDSAGGKKEGP